MKPEIKSLTYALYIYFVIALFVFIIALPLMIDLSSGDIPSYLLANSWIIILSLLGIIFTYKLSKLKKWAFIALIVVMGMEMLILFVASIYFGEGPQLAVLPLVFIIFLVQKLNYFKGKTK